jgi:hypothetical protein
MYYFMSGHGGIFNLDLYFNKKNEPGINEIKTLMQLTISHQLEIFIKLIPAIHKNDNLFIHSGPSAE